MRAAVVPLLAAALQTRASWLEQADVGGRTLDPSSMKCMAPRCGADNFCVGFEDDGHVYCYGSNDGCLHSKKDCATDADCAKYTSSSPKFANKDFPTCPTASLWRAAACTCGSATLCPETCKCSSSTGPNGMAVNSEGYCTAMCSQEYNFGAEGRKRFCGDGEHYMPGDSVDCTGCSTSAAANLGKEASTTPESQDIDEPAETQSKEESENTEGEFEKLGIGHCTSKSGTPKFYFSWVLGDDEAACKAACAEEWCQGFYVGGGLCGLYAAVGVPDIGPKPSNQWKPAGGQMRPDRCIDGKFNQNFCSQWCKTPGKWGCGVAKLSGSDPRNTDNVDYSCDCNGCNGCPSTRYNEGHITSSDGVEPYTCFKRRVAKTNPSGAAKSSEKFTKFRLHITKTKGGHRSGLPLFSFQELDTHARSSSGKLLPPKLVEGQGPPSNTERVFDGNPKSFPYIDMSAIGAWDKDKSTTADAFDGVMVWSYDAPVCLSELRFQSARTGWWNCWADLHCADPLQWALEGGSDASEWVPIMNQSTDYDFPEDRLTWTSWIPVQDCAGAPAKAL